MVRLERNGTKLYVTISIIRIFNNRMESNEMKVTPFHFISIYPAPSFKKEEEKKPM